MITRNNAAKAITLRVSTSHEHEQAYLIWIEDRMSRENAWGHSTEYPKFQIPSSSKIDFIHVHSHASHQWSLVLVQCVWLTD